MSEAVGAYSGLDTLALNGVPSFENIGSGKYWQCKSIEHRAGLRPSEAVISIPLAGQDDDAPAVVGIGDSPLNGLAIGSRCKVDADGMTEFCGSVVAVEGDIRADVAEITVLDDRWLLQGMPIVGSFWMDGDGSSIVYRQSMRAHCNQDGLPNCIWVGGVPVFCTPRFGLNVGEDPSSPAARSSTKACYWTPTSVGVHVQWLAQNAGTASSGDAWMPDLPASISWPDGWIDDPDQSVPAPRKAREFILDGLNVLDAAQMALTALGPWALSLQYSGYGSTIVSVRTHFDPDASSMSMTRPLGPADPAMADPLGVVGGALKIDGTNYYSVFVATGAPVQIERRASFLGSAIAPSGGGTDSGGGGPLPGDGGGGDGGGGEPDYGGSDDPAPSD